MCPCKWNHVSSEKNISFGSVSFSATDCRNKLQKWTLLTGSRGWKAWMDYCCFIGSKIQQSAVLKIFAKLWIASLLGTLSSRNLRRIFADTFQQFRISRIGVIQKYNVTLKHTAPSRNILVANCNWEETANGADNCRLQQTNHKQTPTHERTALRET
jgi:hypothetical protein